VLDALLELLGRSQFRAAVALIALAVVVRLALHYLATWMT
jgi:hypothetical protein